jgi:hypothetical protein
MTCELVISGWYASTQARAYNTAGDDVIRGTAFRPLWWKSLDTYIKPQHVLIVDSASPVKANDSEHTSTAFQHVELLTNPGHAQNGSMHYSGYMAAVILGLEFALHSDVDMVLYVEQDALVFGQQIVEKVKNALRRRDFVFGASRARDIQQSFFAISKRGLRPFLKKLHAIRHSDREVAPEYKFIIAASHYIPRPLIQLARHTRIDGLRAAGLKAFALASTPSRNYGVLPFGYGRERPIDFSDDAFYFQHGSAEEILRYRQRTGF